MKSTFAFCAILFFISVASAFWKGSELETLKTINEEKAALKLTEYTDSSVYDPQQVQSYLELIDNREVMKLTNQKIQVSDFAVKALEEITKIRSNNTSNPVKAILSCVKGNKVYRYHLVELSTSEQTLYKKRINNWLKERVPH